MEAYSGELEVPRVIQKRGWDFSWKEVENHPGKGPSKETRNGVGRGISMKKVRNTYREESRGIYGKARGLFWNGARSHLRKGSNLFRRELVGILEKVRDLSWNGIICVAYNRNFKFGLDPKYTKYLWYIYVSFMRSTVLIICSTYESHTWKDSRSYSGMELRAIYKKVRELFWKGLGIIRGKGWCHPEKSQESW